MQLKLMGSLIASMGLLSAWSQEVDIYDSLAQSPQQQFEYITQNLDFSSVTTGLLADKCLPLIPYQNYDGQHLADTNKASAFAFGKLYATLSGMAIDSTYYLPHPSSYNDTIVETPLGQIYLGGIHFKYHQFKPYAIDSGLITNNNTQLFDVTSPAESPYETKEAFLFTPLLTKTASLTNDFIFRPELFYSNTGKTIDSIHVDFGDGEGNTRVSANYPVTVMYESAGVKTIVTVIYYSDLTSYTSHAQLNVLDAGGSGTRDYAFDSLSIVLNTETIWATTPYNPGSGNEYGSAYVTTLLACGHEKLIKPLIWVEGFNPKVLTDFDPEYNLDPVYMQDILNYEDVGINNLPLLDYCEEEGYDLVYVNFFDGGDWIQKNAYVVQEVIRWVNEQKAQNGSNEKNVIIGESMGGIIAKYALRKMEQASEDHQTKTLMTLDSPHQGANIPLCAQFAAKHIPYISIGGNPLWEYLVNQSLSYLPPDLPDIRLGEQMLNSHAAKQMLIYQAPDNFSNQAGTDLHSSEYVTFYTEYSGLGALQNCDLLMSSNGSPYGSSGGQNFSPGDELIKFNFNNGFLHNLWLTNINGEVTDINGAFTNGFQSLGASMVWAIGSIFAQGFFNFRLNALPNYSSSLERVYKGHISTHFIGIPVGVTFTHKTVNVKEVYPFDSSPGGFFKIPMTLELDSLPPFVQLAVDNDNIVVAANTFDFVPIFSSLDLPLAYKTNPYADLSNLDLVNSNSSALRTVQNDNPYPYHDFFKNPDTLNNSLHINFYQNNAEWFLFHLIGNNGINANTSWSSGSFNFGEGVLGSTNNYTNTDHKRTTSRIDVLDEITGTGQVSINVANKIGHIQVDNGPYTATGTSGNPTNFVVTLKRQCSSLVETLTVSSGGLLYIGEGPYQTGELHLMEGTTLTIGNGGDLYIQPNSKIVVHPGAKLIFANGSDIYNQGTIELLGTFDGAVWTSAVLEMYPSAYLEMEHDNAQIHFNGGDLLLKQNTTFVMYHTTGPSGHLRFSAFGPHIHGESNTSMDFGGDVDYDPIIYLEEDADFWNDTPDDLDQITLSKGTVIMDENSRFVSTQRLGCSQVNFDAVSSTDNRGVVTFEKSVFSSCEFNDVRIEAWQIFDADAHLLITNSEVNNHDHTSGDYPSVFVTGKSYTCVNTEFTPTSSFATLSSKMLTGNSIVTGSTFNATGQADAKIIEKSDVLLRVNTSNFLNSSFGIIKKNGELGLRCNSFDYVDIGLTMLDNSRLYAALFGNHYGYNVFTNVGDYSIRFQHAIDAALFEGYNDFGTNEYYFDGTMNFYVPPLLSPYLPAQGNTWEGAATSPSSSNYNLYHEGVQASITVLNHDPVTTAECGENDPDGGVIIGGVTDPEVLSNLPVIGFEGHEDNAQKSLDDLVADAMGLSEVYDSLHGNNSDAMELFHAIITYDYSGYDEDTIDIVNMVLNFAYYQMKYTLYNAFEQQQITEADNAETFDEDVAKFADAINVRSGILQDLGNDYLLFYNEMEKAYFYRLLGHYDMAIDILENAEYCGLDSTEQVYLNELKFDISEENALRSYGYRAILMDTVFTDSSSYTVPSGSSQKPYLFRSTLNDVDDISFDPGCGYKPYSYDVDEPTINFEVYPNPNDGTFMIKYYLPEEASGLVQIHSLDGKLISTIPCKEGDWTQKVTLNNCRSGIYFYTYLINGVNIKTGKLIVN